MLLEISFMQRFILLLGHPIYALALILFVLLSFGGLGSLTVERLSARQASLVCLGITVLSLVVWYLYPLLFRALARSSTAGKAAATALLLAPVGYLMGMPFPIGLRALKNQALIPWMWGVNGATSVLASILGMILALSMGYTAALVTGAASYLTAFLLLPSVQRAGER
ncbi:MAG: hypothetical protein HY652_11915 [Acidobacteria bacterium]|nr:hypothetical protein [Acidobacteriota bacterium]